MYVLPIGVCSVAFMAPDAMTSMRFGPPDLCLRRWRRRGAVLALDGIVESCDPGQAVIGYDRFLKADEAGW